SHRCRLESARHASQTRRQGVPPATPRAAALLELSMTDNAHTCPACGHENLAAAKFCGECGTRLNTVCATCGFVNSVEHNFCSECGASLSTPPATQRPAPSSYTPRHLEHSVLLTRSAIEGERKQVTVLFCDIVGST